MLLDGPKEKLIEIIALTIGNHFWHCQTDAEAITCGLDCAKEVVEALENK